MSRIGDYREAHGDKIPKCITCDNDAHLQQWNKRTGEPQWRKYCNKCHNERGKAFREKMESWTDADAPRCGINGCEEGAHLIGQDSEGEFMYTPYCSYHNSPQYHTDRKYLNLYGLTRREYFDQKYMEEYGKTLEEMEELRAYYKDLNRTQFNRELAFINEHGIGYYEMKNNECLEMFGMSMTEYDDKKLTPKYHKLSATQYREKVFREHNGYPLSKRHVMDNMPIVRFIYNGDENIKLRCMRSGIELEDVHIVNHKTGEVVVQQLLASLHHMKVKKGKSVGKRGKEPSSILKRVDWDQSDIEELLICTPLSRDEHFYIHLTSMSLDLEHYLPEHRPWVIRSRENFELFKVKYDWPDLDYDKIINRLK